MKRLILLAAASSLLVLGSCNKDKKFNKDLDGTWLVTTVDGNAVTSDDASKFVFSKDGKDDGSVSVYTYSNNAQTTQATGTYKISDKGKTLVIDVTGTTSGNNPDTFTAHASGSISNQDDKKFTYNVSQTTTGGPFNLGVTQNHIYEFTRQ